MEIKIPEAFYRICVEISSEGKTREEWVEQESSDMFQTNRFCGGFDADEMAFCFSYLDHTRTEYWFQLSLTQVLEISAGKRKTITIRLADG